MYHPFSIAETIKTAWKVIKKNYIILIVFTMVTFLGEIAKDALSTYFEQYSVTIQILGAQIISIIATYLTLSYYKLLLTLIDREYYEFEFKDILPSFKMVCYAVLIVIVFRILYQTLLFIDFRLINNVYLLYLLMFLQGITIVYFLIRLIFCLCFIVDDDSGPIESLKQSFAITKNNFFKLLGMVLIVFVFVALILLLINGFITLFVDQINGLEAYLIEFGAICWFAITFPTVQVTIITTYRKLVYSAKDVEDDVSEAL
ncbi:glycerophosphoryl diester phosphodiesterase membrane domain-containing protein [Mucilaginibacter lacusdianchii]|uniref:glycerophosphoryl diester phosphodiesterase membrane domain-containing protein n=1 Tax=Mucilaginibacter lacusdianchii TaxID=2684211 RepID=UPI00131B641F|nr:glycerophosphoryl diester phosphodiesterase membrane domain-containing protein [Mucilaginibacter sp. JXJ CY 39]